MSRQPKPSAPKLQPADRPPPPELRLAKEWGRLLGRFLADETARAAAPVDKTVLKPAP